MQIVILVLMHLSYNVLSSFIGICRSGMWWHCQYRYRSSRSNSL